jgi:hypothetical protein
MQKKSVKIVFAVSTQAALPYRLSSSMFPTKSARAVLTLLFLVSFALLNWAQDIYIDVTGCRSTDLDILPPREYRIPDISEQFSQREPRGEPVQLPPRSKVDQLLRTALFISFIVAAIPLTAQLSPCFSCLQQYQRMMQGLNLVKNGVQTVANSAVAKAVAKPFVETAKIAAKPVVSTAKKAAKAIKVVHQKAQNIKQDIKM